MRNNKKRKGFTIVELVIVIAVIGILAAILIPTFLNLTSRANRVSNESFVRNINTQLAIDDASSGKKYQTPYDAMKAAHKMGFLVDEITPYEGNDIIWDSEANRFAIVKADFPTSREVVYADQEFKADKELYKYFKFYDTMPKVQTYSIAAKKSWNVADVTGLKVGFDVGEAEGIASVSYVRDEETSPRSVKIRTTSASTALSIKGYVDSTDSKIGDVIYHYGAAGDLDIVKCAMGSYHENGKIAYAGLTKGRVVLEEGSKITHIHINKSKTTANTFEEPIITNNGGAEELPEKITRDSVTVTSATPVVTVESNGVRETVYVYADTETGDKGSTERITEGDSKQNENVTSALGQLVLDDGSESKALDEEAKADVKEEVIETAQNIEEVEKAEDAGYEITHHEALAPTCTEDGHTAYDSYFVNNVEQKVGYKVIEALGHDVDPETGICNRCAAQVYVFKVGTSLYKSNEFSAAWAAAKNSNKDFKILSDLTMNALPVDGKFSIDLNGKTLTLRGHASLSGAVRVYGLTDYGGDLTVKNGTLSLPGTNNSNYGIYSEGNLTLENVSINSACKTTVYVDGLAWNSVGSANLTNVVINATHASGTAYNAHSVSMYGTTYSPVSNLTNVTITSANDAVMINATNANLHSCNITASGRAAWIIFSATGNTIGTMTIDGETTLNAGSAYNRLNAQDGNTISILAGTYNFDPSNNNSKNYVPEGYAASDNGDGTWTVAAAA